MKLFTALSLFSLALPLNAVVYWNNGDVVTQDVVDEDIVINGTITVGQLVSVSAIDKNVRLILESHSRLIGQGELIFNSANGKTIIVDAQLPKSVKAFLGTLGIVLAAMQLKSIKNACDVLDYAWWLHGWDKLHPQLAILLNGCSLGMLGVGEYLVFSDTLVPPFTLSIEVPFMNNENK